MDHGASSKDCTILSVFFVLATLFGLTVAAPDFTQYLCSNNIGNYTKNSKYQANLNTLLSSLSTDVNPYGFYNSSVGEDPDRAYALVLCRGDASFQDCETCVNDAANLILELCPNQKEAIGWYTICMIRYSNKNFFGNMSTRPKFNLQSSVVPSNLSRFNQDLSNLTDSLRDQTVAGSSLKFAAGTRKSASNITIYALMQCTPDIDAGDCNLCLGWALQVLSQCCYRTEGARVIGPSCSFWYEVFPFYNERVILSRRPPPPPPPSSLPPSLAPSLPKPTTKGKHGNNTTIIIIGVVGGVALGLLSFCIFFFGRKWRNRRKEKKFEDLEEGDGVKAVQYDFGVISAATNNFSSTNLLWKGGFGAVYKWLHGPGICTARDVFRQGRCLQLRSVGFGNHKWSKEPLCPTRQNVEDLLLFLARTISKATLIEIRQGLWL